MDDFKQVFQSLQTPGVGFMFSSGVGRLNTEFKSYQSLWYCQ